MPRKPRIDFSGHFYHVISHGIERRELFVEEGDYEDFLRRLKKALNQKDPKGLAFSLLPNHFHLLCLRGTRPLIELMRRLTTGHAVPFNPRYQELSISFRISIKRSCVKGIHI